MLKTTDIPKILILFIFYFFTASFGLKMGAVSGFASMIWPPTGIALAALLLYGYKLWPGITLGAFLVNYMAGAPLLAALAISAGNTLEAVTGTWLLHSQKFNLSFNKLKDIIKFVLFGVILCTLISPLIGITSLVQAKVITVSEFGQMFQAWWLGDMLGALLITPLLLALFDLTSVKKMLNKWTWRHFLEFIFFLSSLTIVVFFLFFGYFSTTPYRQYVFFLFPWLIWSCVRFEKIEVILITFGIVVCAIWGTVLNTGPFASGSFIENLFYLQIFLAIMQVSTLVLSLVMKERNESIRSREDIMAIVSHDIRNPLSAIKISASLLLKQFKQDTLEKENILKAAQIIDQSTNRINGMITDILEAEKIEANLISSELKLKEEKLLILVSEALIPLEFLAQQKGIEIEKKFPDHEILVMCDKGKIIRVISNLVGNAIKFSKEKSSIVIEIKNRKTKPGKALLLITDSGPGIPSQDLPYVFTRYWKRKSSKDSLGLGLFIAKGIINAHGGNIYVKSKINVGTTFYFTLPIQF